MSIEFRAPVKLSNEHFKKLAQVFERDPAYELISSSVGKTLSLRIVRFPKTSHREDIAMYVQDCDLLIALHSSTGSERDEFIGKVARVLAEMGITAEFEEI
jgi:hypothetical protein